MDRITVLLVLAGSIRSKLKKSNSKSEMSAEKTNVWLSRLDYIFLLRPMLFFPGWSTKVDSVSIAVAILLYDFYRPVQAEVWGRGSISVPDLPFFSPNLTSADSIGLHPLSVGCSLLSVGCSFYLFSVLSVPSVAESSCSSCPSW